MLIPSPNVAEDHQRHNAEALSSVGAAVMILDKDAVTALPGELKRLLDSPDEVKKLETAIAGMGRPDADERIADEIDRLTNARG